MTSTALAERPPWQARIKMAPDGGPQGGGVLCAERWVLTAAHVLARGDQAPARVWVDFPFVPGVPAEAVVVPGGWHPPAGGNRADLALLELTGPLPDGARPAPVRIPAEVTGHRFRAYGFPRGHDDGVWAYGEVEGPAMGEWTQLVADAGRGYLIDKGFSGSPVWDETLGAVTGIVVSREIDATVRAGFAVGAEVAGRYLPMLGPWLRWRVSVDPDFAGYWDPRARGVERGSRPGRYFTGRDRAVEKLTGWIADSDRGSGLCVVTGDPGSGKSALIARLLALGDPQLRAGLAGADPAGVMLPPAGWASAGARASGLRLGELSARLGAGLAIPASEPGQLIDGLAGRPGAVVVVDAVDEAADDPARIVRELLVPLADDAAVRVLAGSRRGRDRGLLRAFGPAATVLDLDDPEFFALADLVGYAASSLRLDGAVRAASPYRDDPEATALVAAGIAAAARPSFLVAGLAARARAAEPAVVDASVPGWAGRQAFPETVGAGLDQYLSRLPDPQRALELLVPVAFGRGAGLPRDGVWADLAAAYGGRPAPPAEVDRLLASAAAYLLESASAEGEPVVSLFHQALADHVRTLVTPAGVETLFTEVLTRRAAEAGGWLSADRYTRRHLAAHAAAAGRLDALLEDPGYLIAGLPDDLVPVLPATVSDRGRHIASIYRRCAHALRDLGPGDRAGQLALAARQAGDDELAARLDRLPVRLGWRALWAHWDPGQDHLVTEAWHALGVDALAVGTLRDGAPVVVSAGRDGTVQVCDLESGTALRKPVRVHQGPVDSIAVGTRPDATSVIVTGGSGGIMVAGGTAVRIWDLESGADLTGPLPGDELLTRVAVGALRDGTPVVLSGGLRQVRVRDLRSGAPLGAPLVGCDDWIFSVAGGALRDGTPVAVGGGDGTIWRWNLESGHLRGEPLRVHRGSVNCVAIGAQRDGTPVVISGGRDGTVQVRDLAAGRLLGEPRRCREGWDQVSAVAAGMLSDRTPVVLACGKDQMVHVWDLETGRAVGRPLRGHTRPVQAVVMGARRDGTPVVVSGSQDQTVRVWELPGAAPGQPAGNSEAQDQPASSVAVGTGRDGAAVMVTGGDAVRLWDLQTGAPLGRPLRHGGYVRSVAAGELRDGTPVIVTGGDDGVIRAWDLDHGTAIGQPLRGHEGTVFAVAIGRRGDGTPVVISGGHDCTTRIWDLESFAAIGEPLGQHNDWVTSVAAGTLRDGTPVAVSGGSEDETVLRWNLDTGAPVGEPLTGHDAVVSALATGSLADGTPVLATADAGAVRIFDLDTGAAIGEPLAGHEDLVTAVALGAGHDGTPVVISGQRSGAIRVWELTPEPRLRARIDVRAGIREIRMSGSRCAVAADGIAVIALGSFTG